MILNVHLNQILIFIPNALPKTQNPMVLKDSQEAIHQLNSHLKEVMRGVRTQTKDLLEVLRDQPFHHNSRKKFRIIKGEESQCR